MRHSKIFNTQEVQAIMQGRMTAFYELVEPQPIHIHGEYYDVNIKNGKHGYYTKGTLISSAIKDPLFIRATPYALNAKIYVREICSQYHGSFIYQPDERYNDVIDGCLHRWYSPATMPKSAARNWLQITEVKCVRISDLDGDALDGLNLTYTCPYCYAGYKMSGGDIEECSDPNCGTTEGEEFLLRVDHFNKHGQASWEANPFIFLYTFKIDKK